MSQYQRLMPRRGANSYSDSERAELLQLLVSAPGVNYVEVLERHPNGGYRVRLDASPDALDDFVAHLSNHDWTLAI